MLREFFTFKTTVLCLLTGILISACATTPARAGKYGIGYTEKGYASWYGPGFDGKATASGEIYDQDAMTAAHKKLPFGTLVEVTRRDTGDRIVVRITDRGPFVKQRILDLSREAARQLGALNDGVIPVRLKVIGMPDRRADLGRFAVQLGLFENPHGARHMMAELEHRIPGLQLVEDTERGAVRLVSRIFTSRTRAARLARHIRRSLGRDAFVTEIH